MAIIVDHRLVAGKIGDFEYTIFTLVLQRIRFLEDDSALAYPDNPNAVAISVLTFEVMNCLNTCFEVPTAELGLETSYTPYQLSIIADLVAYYVLLYRTIALGAGNQGFTLNSNSMVTSSPAGTFIKRHKSDDVEVEWDKLTVKDSANLGDINKLMQDLLDAAGKKLAEYGCSISECSHCALIVSKDETDKPYFVTPPFNC